MVLTAYPPIHPREPLSRPLSPSSAQTHLSAFLRNTSTQPHLHPDSLLSSTGITYAAQSGPSGGLAIHHLRRIDAGLRGEVLGQETEEELAEFKVGVEPELPAGDDRKLDEVIEAGANADQGARGRKRPRKTEKEIGRWAAESSEAALGEPGDRTAEYDTDAHLVTEHARGIPSVESKAARKQAKRARRKVEKAENMQQRKAGMSEKD